jgi:aminoglycoside phosphotransferase (APT) family kinase protein
MSMKSRWPRGQPVVPLGPADVARLIAPACPGAEVADLSVVGGGLINTNVKVILAGPAEPVLLRIYQRGAAEGRKEAALAARLAGRVPIARFLHFSDADAVTGHPYAVQEWIEGRHLDVVAASADTPVAAALGHAVGATLAAVHAIKFDRCGFFGPDLTVPAALDFGRDGLLAYLHQCLVAGPGGDRIGAPLTTAWLTFAEREGHRLGQWLDRPCLVHGDFNGPNILVRPNSAGNWEVAAILDWEFALSGPPGLDFGNLLRPPLGGNEVFVEAMAAGYHATGLTLPPDWQRISRLTDLFAWADLVSRTTVSEVVIEDARRTVRGIIDGDSGDASG